MPQAPVFQFRVEKAYTRRFISAHFGGSHQLYLPTRGGKVVAGCFDEGESLNPGAPTTVYFGDGPVVIENARKVAAQSDPIPVFVRVDHGRWVYQGRYRCVGIDETPEACHAALAAHPAREVIKGILTFERVGD